MANRNVRLPDKLNKSLEDEATRRGISVNSAHIEAIEHFLQCKKAEATSALKLIPLKYSAKCHNPTCRKQIEVGEFAWWGKDPEGSIVICTDCQIRRHGDKATVTKLLKVKELEYQKQILTQELDDLVAKYGEYNFYEVIQKVHDKNSEVTRLIMDYFTKMALPEEEKRFKEVMDAHKELFKLIEEARKFMQQPWTKKKKKKAQNYVQ